MSLLKIINKSINEIKPYKNNPRNNSNSIENVALSIKNYGFKVPILIDKNNEIICGHTRYEAAKLLDLKTIPCIMVNDLSEKQIKAFRLVDNKVSEFSDWDYEKLMEELSNIDSDFINKLNLIENLDNISNEDFIKDTEITKEKTEKELICPKCGKSI